MFASLVKVLEKVEISQRVPSSTSEELLSSYRQLINVAKTSDSDHAVFRLLFPVDDHRRKYDMAERRLATGLVDCLGLSGTKRGERLIKWKHSISLDHDLTAVSDLGVAVQRILQEITCVFESSVSLRQIDKLMDELAQLSHFSKADLRQKTIQPRASKQVLRDLFCTLSPIEAKWLTRIILRTSQTYAAIARWTMMNLRYWFMTDLFSVHNEFDHVLNIVHKLEKKRGILSIPEDPLHLIALVERYLCPRIGHRVEMLKCEKGLSSVHVHKLLQHTTNKDKVTAWAEIKYDGERMQIHVDRSRSPGKQIVIFSKSGRESTADRHRVLRNIREALALDDPHSALTKGIFEAELLVYDNDNSEIAEFDKIKEVMVGNKKRLSGAAFHLHPLVVFFDCLMVNGQSLLHAEYVERRAALEKHVHFIKTRAELAQRTRIDFIADSTSGIAKLQNLMAEVVASRKEGLIIKPAVSTYLRHFRSDATPLHWRRQQSTKPIWVKFKKDYIPGLGDTADFAILGGSYNPERAAELRICREVNTQILTDYYAGFLLNKITVQKHSDIRPQFLVLSIIQTGLNSNQLSILEKMTKYTRCNQPSYDVYFPPNIRHHQIDTWFRTPLVFACYGADFVRVCGSHICTGTPTNKGQKEIRFHEKQYELRFPRMQQIHHDRDWTDCTSLAELQRMAARKPLSEVSRDKDAWSDKLQLVDNEHLRRDTLCPPSSCKKLLMDVDANKKQIPKVSKPPKIYDEVSSRTKAPRSPIKSLWQLDESFVAITTRKTPHQTRKRPLDRLPISRSSTVKRRKIEKPAPTSSAFINLPQEMIEIDAEETKTYELEDGLTLPDSAYSSTSSKLAKCFLFFTDSIIEPFHHQKQSRLLSFEALLKAAGWTDSDRKEVKPGIIFVSDTKEAIRTIRSLESSSKTARSSRARISVVDMSTFVKTDDLDSSEYYPYS